MTTEQYNPRTIENNYTYSSTKTKDNITTIIYSYELYKVIVKNIDDTQHLIERYKMLHKGIRYIIINIASENNKEVTYNLCNSINNLLETVLLKKVCGKKYDKEEELCIKAEIFDSCFRISLTTTNDIMNLCALIDTICNQTETVLK